MGVFRLGDGVEPLGDVALARGAGLGRVVAVRRGVGFRFGDGAVEIAARVARASQRIAGVLQELQVAEPVTGLTVGQRAQEGGDVGTSLDVRAARKVEASERRLGLTGESLADVCGGRRAVDAHDPELWHVRRNGNAACANSDLSGSISQTMASVPFDRSVLKVNQVILIVGIIAAYFVSFFHARAAYVLPALALMMLASVVTPTLNLPRQLYLHLLKPSRLVRPRVHVEDPAPHRFAQLVGGVFLAVASIIVFIGPIGVAWILGWIVVALAFLNFAFDICVGCIVYAQLVRAGVLPLRRRAPSGA